MEDLNTRIFCDESCHLLNDNSSIITFGAIQCPSEKVRQVSLEIKAIKEQFSCAGELKWTKVSPKNLQFYKTLIKYFDDQENLKFRALIVKNKKNLNHDIYNNGEHDNFYYKMYYYLLRNIIEKKNVSTYEMFIDIKDTKSSLKVKKLQEVLSNSFYDFEMIRIRKIQQIRSEESNLLQLCDFLLGAVTYDNRELDKSAAKLLVAKELSSHFHTCLTESTSPWEEKFNLFHFTPRGDGQC